MAKKRRISKDRLAKEIFSKRMELAALKEMNAPRESIKSSEKILNRLYKQFSK